MKRLLAITLAALVGASALPGVITAQQNPDPALLWNQPGPGEVRNETGEPGRDIYIVRHQAPSLAQYRGGIAGLRATSPEVTGADQLNPRSAASRAYLDFVNGLHDQLELDIEAAIGRQIPASDVVFRYDAVYNGIAVRITADEAERVARLPGVRHVERDSRRELHTDNGPVWIGADEVWGEEPPDGNAPCVGTCGEGVVVGIIDTGINFDHPSFADIGGDGYNHTNPRAPTFFGACTPVTGLPFCNDKLIGYYDFTGTGPEDDNGHGSHTASTTAGNVLHATVVAPTITIERDVAGVAPHANIISYKGCSGTPIGCLLSALVAAINQATLDQVDVINYSIGGSSANPWEDLDSQAFFDAYTAGIFVATSAGNGGPGFGTLGSPADAPWVTSVGASTHDRQLANGIVDMTNNGGTAPAPADIFGKSLTSGSPIGRVVYAGDYADESADPPKAHLCGAGTGNPATGEGEGDPWPPGTFTGMIVVCDRGEYGRVFKGEYVRRAGAAGFVLANDAASGDSLIGDPYTLPGVHITFDDGVVLKAWIADNGGKDHLGTGRIRGSEPAEDAAFGDVMASFSSRGANPAVPSVIKPDVTAPGVDILAAWMSPVGTAPGGDPEWGIISGTSMSSPHTAGAGALVIAANPTWGPDAVKSALMTTAFTTTPGNGGEVHGVLKEDAATPADPFDMGGGRVDLHVAADAGIVFNETVAGYEAANPALGGDASTLNMASLGNNHCPSACVWTRSMTSTAGTNMTWTPSSTTPAGMTITFDQPSYNVAPGATVDITITADVSGVSPQNVWTFAEVQLTPSVGSIPTAHLPVAVIPVGGGAATVLHMHGNIHDGCTGVGATDVVADPETCQPHLSEDDELDEAQAAAWGPTGAANGTAPQNIHDPNWIWNLSEPTTVLGPMTVEWWYKAGPSDTLLLFDDFRIRLFADGELVTEEVVRHNSEAPVPILLSSTIVLPKTTANESFVIQIDPVFANQVGSFIYYDSTQPCPGVPVGVTAECDSRVLMPVVELTDLPPVAVNDLATVNRGGTVVVDVLANDSDPEGGPLSVTIVSQPTNGTAEVTTDNRISYSHDGSETTADSFVYEITDIAGQSDQATVFITILNECFLPAGDYAIDFEDGSPGWTVDTDVLTPPSQTWQLMEDPFASSPTTSWFTDALASDPTADTSKDVRLVTPEFLVSGDSHLTFFHRFKTETGFDGGVLEASLGGDEWQDILAAGGVFDAGAYNDTLNPGSGFVLSGRAAWGGESSGFQTGAMNQVDVDLAALAGQSVQFRFRFAQDQLQPETGGWWIDDFAVNSLLMPCPIPPIANPDNAMVEVGMSVNIDVLANDSDPEYENSELTVTIETPPSDGTADVELDQTITYTHNGTNNSPDSFVYKVTNPDGGFDTATVSITLGCEEPPFPDVPITHIFCPEITWMKDEGISGGYTDGTYRPENSTRRQEMAAFMARLGGGVLTPCAVEPFTDVPTDHFFCAEIQWMKDNDITGGFEDGTYRPLLNVNRQEMAAFMARLGGATLDDCTTAPFTDVPIDHFFCREIKWMKDNGVTGGFLDGTYRPLNLVNRGQMAAFTLRLSVHVPGVLPI